MPTRAGIPVRNPAHPAVPGYIGPLNPPNWLDFMGSEACGINPHAVQRGQPPALAWWQRRQIPQRETMAQPRPWFAQSPQWDRGADAFAPQFGRLNINPIGAGVYAPYRLPTIAGPGARYQWAAIWFDVQTIPTSLNINPTVPMETVNALLATSYVAGSYRTTG